MKLPLDSWSILPLGALLVPLVMGCFSAGSPQYSTLIEYHRSGGIQGLDDHLVIYDDGTAALTRKGARSEFTVEDAVMEELRSLLKEMKFRKLRKEYLPARGGADLFEYMITHDDHTVRTKDMAIPEGLMPLIDLLDQIISTST